MQSSEPALAPPRPAPRRRGRPPRGASEQRHSELLEKALDIFLDKGFEQTTTDAIAAAVRVSKRTLYAFYPDKEALFKAAVQEAIRKSRVPEEQIAALDIEDLPGSLRGIADLRIAQILSPFGIKLQRIIQVASFRFPDLIRWGHAQLTGPTEEFVRRILLHHAARGAVRIDDPQIATRVFMAMVIGSPSRAAMMGIEDDIMAREELVAGSLRMFMRSIRPD
jgi:AcrR family transcriptional regulator